MNNSERKNVAERHYAIVRKRYAVETELSVRDSVIYDNFTELPEGMIGEEMPLKIRVMDLTTERAVFDVFLGQCGVLNFASYTRAGGGFLNGSIAQEEAICHVSNLYNVLEHFTDIYNDNYKDRRDGLYRNWAIFSPSIVFVDKNGMEYLADVITCPAPNAIAAAENSVGEEEIEAAMRSRIEFLLDICELNNERRLVLGAFGCGVFGNRPDFVAKCFNELLTSGRYSFEDVVFAIPCGTKPENFEAFKKEFENFN